MHRRSRLRQDTALRRTLLDDKSHEALLHPGRPRWPDESNIRGRAAVCFAAFHTEIDFARRAIAGDVLDFEVQDLRDQGAEYIADAAGSAFAEARRGLRRAHALDACVRRVFAAG